MESRVVFTFCNKWNRANGRNLRNHTAVYLPAPKCEVCRQTPRGHVLLRLRGGIVGESTLESESDESVMEGIQHRNVRTGCLSKLKVNMPFDKDTATHCSVDRRRHPVSGGALCPRTKPARQDEQTLSHQERRLATPKRSGQIRRK